MAIYKGEQCLAGVGKNATIKIGTAKTGTSAAVTNSGTDTDAILNFTLPKGDQGVGISSVIPGTTDYNGLKNKPVVNGAVTAYQSDIMKSQLRNVTFSTEEPKTTDGKPGDMWVVYGDE